MGWAGDIPYDNGCIGYQAVNGWKDNRDDRIVRILKESIDIFGYELSEITYPQTEGAPYHVSDGSDSRTMPSWQKVRVQFPDEENPTLQNPNYKSCSQVLDIAEKARKLASKAYGLYVGCCNLCFTCKCNYKSSWRAYEMIAIHWENLAEMDTELFDITGCEEQAAAEYWDVVNAFTRALYGQEGQGDVAEQNKKLLLYSAGASAALIGLLMYTKRL
jgi:hypothetical protein